MAGSEEEVADRLHTRVEHAFLPGVGRGGRCPASGHGAPHHMSACEWGRQGGASWVPVWSALGAGKARETLGCPSPPGSPETQEGFKVGVNLHYLMGDEKGPSGG